MTATWFRRVTAGIGVAAAAVAVAVATTVAPAGPASAGPADSSARQQLAAEIRAAIAHSSARHVDWRFDVAGVGSIYHDPATMTAPASNNKVFIGESALQRLGPSYVYVTKILTDGQLVGTTLHGALIFKASGDPLLTDTGLATLARQIRQLGIHKVTGGLTVDDKRYRHRTTAPGWKRGFTPSEVGPVDAFALDENWWKTSPSYVAHTAVANANRFRGILRRHRVYLKGRTRIGTPDGTHLLTSLDSQPLSAIVAEMLTNSDNFVAEMLLDELGKVAGTGGNRVAGIRVVHREAAALRASVGTINDGSGLSYADRESPDLLVGWLDAAAGSSTGQEFQADLPVACETGTLKDRLCGKATKGQVHAKTGTLSNVRALSGYATTKSGAAVTFSILLSGIRNMTRAEQRMDAAVATVARWR